MARLVELGEWIHARRTARQWNQQTLAERAGCTKSYISMLERAAPHAQTGKGVVPDVTLVDAIARALAQAPNEERQYVRDARLLAGYAPPTEETKPIIPAELIALYQDLTPVDRQRLVAIGRILRDSGRA
jgi:transcriptional regulator with XRE-family HTH domain